MLKYRTLQCHQYKFTIKNKTYKLIKVIKQLPAVEKILKFR